MKPLSKKTNTVDGENIIYHILQKQIIQANDAVNPPDHVKYMIEQLLLWGGIWFRPETFDAIPVMLPYVIRDSSCRKINPITGKHSWGKSNRNGFLRDDNSLVKAIPRSLKIHSAISQMDGRIMGNGFVASHVWIKLQNRPEHACEWERTNSFVPNLVWLPNQLSKLTDRDGSYAQQFIQHISGLLYRQRTSSNQVLSSIWNELKDPGIKPMSSFDLNDLNYFEHDVQWLNRRKASLVKSLVSILAIVNGGTSATHISCSSYAPSLAKAITSMAHSDKACFESWIKDIYTILTSTPPVTNRTAQIVSPATVKVKKMSTTTSITRVSRFYTINGLGKYKMHEVIGEYIVFKLKGGETFANIHAAISKKAKFISDKLEGVSINKTKGETPHHIEYNGTKYYITTQLRNKNPNDNFSVFMKLINDNEPSFQIAQC